MLVEPVWTLLRIRRCTRPNIALLMRALLGWADVEFADADRVLA